MSGRFVETPIEFAALTEELEAIFVRGARLPNRVFRSLARSRFIDFDFTMMPEFWPAICELSAVEVTRATQITTVVLDPDPAGYWYRHLGYYSAFRLPVSATEDDYAMCLARAPAHSPADALYVNSSVAAWFSDTGRWAVWGERARGAAVVAVAADVDWQAWIAKHQPMSSSHEAPDDLEMTASPAGISAVDFRWLLETNYPA